MLQGLKILSFRMLNFMTINKTTAKMEHIMRKIILLLLGYSATTSLSALEIGNPTTLSPQPEAVWASRAAINNNGAATVVWIKFHDENRYFLQASTRSNSESGWTHAQSISEPMKISTYFPSVAADGTSTIIWTGTNTQQYYYTQKKMSKPWLHPESI